ncbi:MAG: S9 family peptidase, partial [Acidobacteriota bacterium]|nr:S9 family peptidase [Acidobacteriota bacterium]
MNRRCLALVFSVLTLAPLAFSSSASGKRPMTFKDMMAMKRLGDTAVSHDGKWLAYAVTTVNLEQNTKTTQWLIQPINNPNAKPPMAVAVMQPGDGGLQFSADDKRILFLSGREGGQQIWLADFDSSNGTTSNARKLTDIATEADNAKWSPNGKFIVFTSSVYPDCAAITAADFNTGNSCNADKDKALANSKVKAQIWTHLLYRHWDHFTGDKRSHLFYVASDGTAMRDLTPHNPHDVPPFSLDGGGCGCDISPDSKELAYTDNIDPVQAISVSARIFTLNLTNPDAKPVQVSTSAGGNFNPAYSPDGKYLAWRSQARAGYESDKFRLWLYDRATKTGKDLLPKFDNWVDEFAWAPNSQTIYFTSGKSGEEPIFSVNVDGTAKTQWTTIGSTSGELSEIKPMDDGTHLVAIRVRVDQPSEVVRFAPSPAIIEGRNEKGEFGPTGFAVDAKPLTHLNDALLAQLDLPKMDSFWFTAKDGTKIQGFLIRPPNFDPAKKYPLKFLIHGGPQGAWGDAWSYRWNAELFAAN